MSGAPRDLFTGGEFIAVRRDAIDALGSWEAAGVWHRICWRSERTGSWVATIDAIAQECCLSTHKTIRALNEIRNAGWLTSTRNHPRDKTQRWTPVWDGDATVPNPENPSKDPGEIPFTLFDETEETLETGPKLKVVPPVAAEFQEFWDLWPRKKDRGHAEKAYRAARRKASQDAIIGGLRRTMHYITREGGRFIPNPATWLNGERWADELTPPDQPPVDENAWMRRRPPGFRG